MSWSVSQWSITSHGRVLVSRCPCLPLEVAGQFDGPVQMFSTRPAPRPNTARHLPHIPRPVNVFPLWPRSYQSRQRFLASFPANPSAMSAASDLPCRSPANRRIGPRVSTPAFIVPPSCASQALARSGLGCAYGAPRDDERLHPTCIANASRSGDSRRIRSSSSVLFEPAGHRRPKPPERNGRRLRFGGLQPCSAIVDHQYFILNV